MSKLDKDTIIDLHINKHKTISELATLYNVSYAAIWGLLKKKHIKHNSTYGKKYSCNEAFFNCLNETSSYVLGLLYSDGCINKNRVELSLSDKDSVYQVKDALNYNGNIRTFDHSKYKKTYKTSYTLVITSQLLVNSLISLGCVPRKSKTLLWPNIPSLSYPDFIRGYFDGDGCISTSWRTQQNRVPILSSYVSFVGTEAFIIGLQNYLRNSSITSNIKSNGNVKELIIGGNTNLQTLFHLLYTNSNNLKMERKYNKWIKHNKYLELKRLLPELTNGSIPLNRRLYPYINNLSTTHFKSLIEDYLNEEDE
jgi:hypothetical protein